MPCRHAGPHVTSSGCGSTTKPSPGLAGRAASPFGFRLKVTWVGAGRDQRVGGARRRLQLDVDIVLFVVVPVGELSLQVLRLGPQLNALAGGLLLAACIATHGTVVGIVGIVA